MIIKNQSKRKRKQKSMYLYLKTSLFKVVKIENGLLINKGKRSDIFKEWAYAEEDSSQANERRRIEIILAEVAL